MFFQENRMKFFFSTAWIWSAAEMLADGAAMLVIHDALRLVEHLPAALPGHVAEVGVFQIERREQRIEAAELQKFAPVEGAGSAAAVEAGIEIRRRRRRRDGARAARRPATSPASVRSLRAVLSDR